MEGMKRKIAMEKIEKKDSRIVAFLKRRLGLYSKASDLCLLSGAKVASSQSNVSFDSFGQSSVDSVVSSFLPRDEKTAARKELGFWWEDERFAESENYKELSDSINWISSMFETLKGLQSETMENLGEPEDLKKDVVSHGFHQELDQNRTLKFEPCSASICDKDDSPATFEGFIKNSEEEDQILAISKKNSNNKYNSLVGNLDGFNEEHDDEYFDFLMNCEAFSKNMEGYFSTMLAMFFDSQADEDGGAMVMHNDFDEDNLHFSGFSSMT